ncbi:hypothetical protein BN1195_00042 [Chryseobacterium oranimense G311]|uniref:hypothetical protein n=1 Tax=Chryseobacterium oranimense TaxID=421058 RepID=UPI00053398A5|nr:hypothetical protein [Chryseobacterium oranimense]CEJ67766.1 hypothetical protein BN1195_00042 [Chryseobacterium oranimense G311]
MSKKKLLIHEVFEKIRRKSPKDTKSGWAEDLSDDLEKELKFTISAKTLSRYYDSFVAETKEETGIETLILNRLSQYLEYKDFDHFSKTFIKQNDEAKSTTVKISVDDGQESLSKKISDIFITVTNTLESNPTFNMPEFVKQNGMGIVGIILIAGVFFANGTHADKKQKPLIPAFGQLLGAEPEPLNEKNCMYWDKSEYRLADCEDKNPRHDLKPLDSVLLKHFKRINRKDTLNVNNALGVTWYSKFYGNVEFFTMDGEDPENGRELRASTAYIIQKYAGK